MSQTHLYSGQQSLFVLTRLYPAEQVKFHSWHTCASFSFDKQWHSYWGQQGLV